MNRALPTYAVVSTDIRRDLIGPMRGFGRLKILHFYRKASYGDLTIEDLDESLLPYSGSFDLFQRLRRARPDVVQGVEPFAIRLLPRLYAVFAAALLQRIPLVIVTLENRPLGEKHGPVFSRLLRVALRPIFSYARLIIYLNNGAQHNVLSVGRYEGKLQRLMYGTWGVDIGEFSPKRDGREPDFGPGPMLLFVGRLHAEKGVFDLLDAFGTIKEKEPLAKLVLVGDGPARGELEQVIAERKWAENVVLTGTIKNRDLPPYFRAATVFVAPSVTTRKWEEQVGMTNIQAMACGTPVVSTFSGAIPEYVPDGVAGALVPEHDANALATAVLRLLNDDSLRAHLGSSGRKYAEANYQAQINVERAEAAILDILAGKRRVQSESLDPGDN